MRVWLNETIFVAVDRINEKVPSGGTVPTRMPSAFYTLL